jgi:glyoxylase-like metal-dependent hydrolase (beta-lactamase superfamily II)
MSTTDATSKTTRQASEQQPRLRRLRQRPAAPAGKSRNLTDIFITHGHGDHWFAAGRLAERFEARVVATAGTIRADARHRRSAAVALGEAVPGIPPATVTAAMVPDNRFMLEGHDLVIVEVGP